jgi:mRNA-degrading endonuclease RelE of RelBE toxin-antitoxin system
MTYSVELTPLAVSDLKGLRAFDRRRIVDEMEQQLQHQPGVETRSRKRLDNLVPEFPHRLPVWELRVGDYRVFYDIDEESATVFVRTIRRKEHGQTTEEVTRDADND